jgi:hypothetical protein
MFQMMRKKNIRLGFGMLLNVEERYFKRKEAKCRTPERTDHATVAVKEAVSGVRLSGDKEC